MSIIRDGFQSADLDVPVVLPTLNLDFANSQELDPRITFSRGSVGTFVNKNGLIETAAANHPRFDYDPISGECKGLLIEESRQNLLTYSEDFSNSVWTISNSSIQTNAIIAPDGNTTADKWIPNNLTTDPRLWNVTTRPDAFYAFSFYVKSAGFTQFRTNVLGRNPNEREIRVFWDLTAVSFTVEVGSTFGSANIQNVGNGWFRCIVIYTKSGTSTELEVRPLGSTARGDGTSGIYIWGAQLEIPPAGVGAFPTSYIPTSGSTVTRSADNASMTGTNFSSWYNQNEGTFFVSGKATNAQNARILTFNDSTVGVLFKNANGANSTTRGIWGPSTLSNVYGISAFSEIPTNSSYKVAAAIKFPNYYTNYSLNGQISTASRLPNTTLYTNVSQLQISPSAGGGTKGNIISRIIYYPKALSPAQLQYLTQ